LKHKIEYDEILDENKVLKAVDLDIDGKVYRLDRGDLWSLHCIFENCFNRMENPELYEQSPTNRKRVRAKP